MKTRHVTIVATLACLTPMLALAQPGAAKARYPVPPTPLPEDQEIALAMTAAPSEVSSQADIYVLRGTEMVKARAGTNGCSCMVSRDLHEGSLYPICFDQEGTRTLLARQLKETALRAKGLSEADVTREIKAGEARGEFANPTKPALAYMMSSQQFLFSSRIERGVRVGAWHPHIMLSKTGLTAQQLGLSARSKVTTMQVGTTGEGALHEFVVVLPTWSDGKPAPAPSAGH